MRFLNSRKPSLCSINWRMILMLRTEKISGIYRKVFWGMDSARIVGFLGACNGIGSSDVSVVFVVMYHVRLWVLVILQWLQRYHYWCECMWGISACLSGLARYGQNLEFEKFEKVGLCCCCCFTTWEEERMKPMVQFCLLKWMEWSLGCM